jgi:hypothetical protein
VELRRFLGVGVTAPTLGQAEGTTLLVGGALALLAVLYIVKKGPSFVKGAVTGDNALTRSATNADGSAQTAYVGAGPAGTLGAAANSATGGWLSTAGDWFATKLGDLTIRDPNAELNAADAQRAAATAELDARPIDYGSATVNPYGW